MRRHEFWRRQYRDRRYCEHLSQDELDDRIRDIVLNLLLLTPEAKVGLLPITPTGVDFMELWTHVLEEMKLRFGEFPCGFNRNILHREPFPNFVVDLSKRACEALARCDQPVSSTLLKYGRADFMSALHAEGLLRVQPASAFRAMAFNGAIRDDELSLQISSGVYERPQSGADHGANVSPANRMTHRMDVSMRQPSDYWLYCVTRSVNPRLFIDFDAEACVVVHDGEEFERRLRECAADQMSRTEFDSAQVQYIDPLRPSTLTPCIPKAKHFRYLYQNEFRFIWIPEVAQECLAPIDLRLGPLSDIAELIVP